MLKNKLLIATTFTSALLAGSAWAQAPAKNATAVQPIGVVTTDTPVTLVANAGLLNKKRAGGTCILRAGDVVAILGTADGKQLVQRTNLIAVRKPNKETCPKGATAAIDPAVATAWQKNAEAKEADKAAKRVQGKKG